MLRNRATITWIVLLLGFFTFCLLAVGLPVSANWYLAEMMRVEPAQLEVIKGTVLLQKRGSSVASATLSSETVEEGDRITTAASSQAMLWLPGGSNVRLWPDTTLVVGQLRTTRFNSDRAAIKLHQDSGYARLEVAMLLTRNRVFQLATPQGSALLREGSYSIDVQPEQSEVTTHQGSATLEAGARSVELLRGERARLDNVQGPSEPGPSARNLLANGDFAKGLDGWQWGNREEEEAVFGSVAAVVVDGLPAAHLLRSDASKHAETFLVQNVNRDVTDFASLRIGLDVRLVNQSLSGGGWLGSEYPLMVKVKYRDVWGSEATFRRGFYYQNKDGQPTTNGEQVPHDVWVKKEGFDLFSRDTADPRPAWIISVELAASGWSYESLAANVRLTAE